MPKNTGENSFYSEAGEGRIPVLFTNGSAFQVGTNSFEIHALLDGFPLPNGLSGELIPRSDLFFEQLGVIETPSFLEAVAWVDTSLLQSYVVKAIQENIAKISENTH